MTDIRSLRREPPAFRRATVDRIQDLSPYLRRFTFLGPELEGLEIDEPAASVRLLIPSYGSDELVMPTWTGNEFLLPDGRRPLIRTFTPRFLRTDPPELDIDVVLHGDQGASRWASSAAVRDPAAVSGPGRGYEIDPQADPVLLLGDETAVPAISQLLERIPPGTPVVACIEARPDARIDLPNHPGAIVKWDDLDPTHPPGTALLAALQSIGIPSSARVWAAGEAAAMQRVRRHLADRGVDRSRTTVRGYWKHGRAGPG